MIEVITNIYDVEDSLCNHFFDQATLLVQPSEYGCNSLLLRIS